MEAVEAQRAADAAAKQEDDEAATALAEKIKNGGGIESGSSDDTLFESLEGYSKVQRGIRECLKNAGYQGEEERLDALTQLIKEANLPVEAQQKLAHDMFDGQNHYNSKYADVKTKMILLMPDSPFRQKLKELENDRLQEAGFSPIP